METSERKGSLKRRINQVELLLMILMAVVISLVSYYAMSNTFLRFYNEKGLDIVRTIAAEVDGDRLQECLEADDVTGQAYYQELQYLFDVTKSNITDHTYLYMFIPGEDSWTYVVEGHAPGDDPSWLSSYGDVYEYGETEYTRMLPDARAKKPSTEIVLGEDDGYGRPMSNWAPVLNSNGDLVAMVEIDYSLEAIQGQLRDYIFKLILSFVVCIALVVLIVLQIIRRRVTTPLENLTEYVDSYEHGQLDKEKIEDFNSGDEIQWLATAFRDMTLRIETYIHDLTTITAEKERIGAELNVARQIQVDMLPNNAEELSEGKIFNIYASMTPAKEVGGDFYDYYMLDDDHLVITVADVSGKGVGAALFMARSMTILKARTMMLRDPASVLCTANNELCRNNEEMFVTVWLGILDLSTGKLTFANAGHEAPLLRHDGVFHYVKQKAGFVLGGMENIKYKNQELNLAPGDLFFQYTDGVPEATNSSEEQLGTKRVLDIINSHAEMSGGKLLNEMLREVLDFTGDAPQYDDVTMLALYYGGTGL